MSTSPKPIEDRSSIGDFAIIKCPKCDSEIAVDDDKHYDIDCDCGAVIQKGVKA